MKLMKTAPRMLWRLTKIRSTILAAIAAALATIALVLVASGNSAVAASSLVNGNFETGNLTGWTVDTTASGGTASAVASYDYCSAEGALEGDGCGVIGTMNPKEGSYFALLTPGTVSEDTKISQPFGASNGDKVSGWAFFRTGDYLPYDDKAQVVIKSNSGTTVAAPFEESVSSVGQNGNSGWKYWEYTFSGLTGPGQFHIEARIHNTGDSSASPTSAIGLDDVKTSIADPDTTRPSTSATRSVEPNAAGWNKENVTVRLNATDNQGGSGVQKITYSASGAQTIAQTDAPGDSVEVILDKEGTTTLTYYATDKAKNVEVQKSLTLKIDKSAPTGSVIIDDGASRTRSRSVTLTLNATDPSPGSGVSQMRISNTESGLSSGIWEAYSTTKAWTLSSGKGTKTVYVQYRDGAGNPSAAVVTDTIRFAP
jgi:hypothetical protein